MHIKYLIFFIFSFLINISQGQTTIKTMFYNLLNYPTAPPQNRSDILKNILNTYKPDLFMVCELENEIASEDILNYSLNSIPKNYEKAPFVYNQSSGGTYNNLQQNLYYNSDFFTLVNQNQIQTSIRDINHYTLELNTSTGTTIVLEVFITHLKASQGTTNEQLRLDMVTEFTNYLNNLDPTSNILFAGDFNFYTSNESAYQKILDPNNNVILKDVLNINNDIQNWHTNYNFKYLHTQSTRIDNAPFDYFGAGGGLDDRFDFIIFSENIVNNSELNYVSNSYKSFGNNGNCYNKNINDSSCSGEFSFELRNNLYNMSDHLPVIAEIQTNETLSLETAVQNNFIQLKNGNLVNQELNIILNDELIGESLILYNTLGQHIKTIKCLQKNLSTSIKNLQKGLYYLRIKNHNKILKFYKI